MNNEEYKTKSGTAKYLIIVGGRGWARASLESMLAAQAFALIVLWFESTG